MAPSLTSRERLDKQRNRRPALPDGVMFALLQKVRWRSGQRLDRAAPGISRLRTQFLFDADELVVFRQAV